MKTVYASGRHWRRGHANPGPKSNRRLCANEDDAFFYALIPDHPHVGLRRQGRVTTNFPYLTRSGRGPRDIAWNTSRKSCSVSAPRSDLASVRTFASALRQVGAGWRECAWPQPAWSSADRPREDAVERPDAAAGSDGAAGERGRAHRPGPDARGHAIPPGRDEHARRRHEKAPATNLARTAHSHRRCGS